MDIISTSDMRLLDHITIHDAQIPSITLMLQAALSLKAFIDEHYDQEDNVLILCGPGNNGGDGFALATLLIKDHYTHVQVLCMEDKSHMSQDACYYAEELAQLGGHILNMVDPQNYIDMLSKQDMIVDALFGNGLSRDISEPYATLVQAVNQSNIDVVSADIASGIHSDTGQIMGCAIKADTTITFTCATLGQMIYPGSEYCGNLIIHNIGIPQHAFKEITRYPIIDRSIAHETLPIRYSHSHKGSYGKALLIGGSRAMHGAVTLCAKSMLRSGVGMLTIFLPDAITTILAMKIEESMLIPSPSHNGFFAHEAIALLKSSIHAYDTIIIGNGVGRGSITRELVKVVLESNIPCVIDGDAIFELTHHLSLLKRCTSPIIITPHPKEMSYLTGKPVTEIMQDPFTIVKEFAKTYGVTIVLKDQYTFISDGNEVYVNTQGNHALAKGGSGDVLCGIISGLFAQSKCAMEASICGVYVHATCADELIKHVDGNSILPSDLISILSQVFTSLR